MLDGISLSVIVKMIKKGFKFGKTCKVNKKNKTLVSFLYFLFSKKMPGEIVLILLLLLLFYTVIFNIYFYGNTSLVCYHYNDLTQEKNRRAVLSFTSVCHQTGVTALLTELSIYRTSRNSLCACY